MLRAPIRQTPKVEEKALFVDLSSFVCNPNIANGFLFSKMLQTSTWDGLPTWKATCGELIQRVLFRLLGVIFFLTASRAFG